MTTTETHPVGTADLVKRLRSNTPNMAIGLARHQAAARIEQLEAQTTDLGDFLATYMAEAFTLDRSVKELTEALTRANAATAAAYEVAAEYIESAPVGNRSQDRDAIRALATPDQTAALERLIAEAVGPYVEALAWYGEQARLARLIHSEGDAGRNALQADGGKRANAILVASKKGGA